MWLEVTAGPNAGTVVRVDSQPFVIGRGPDAQMRLIDQKVSRRHTALTFGEEGSLIAEDLSSENGTFINGREIADRTLLTDGAVIRVGDTVISFTVEAPGAGGATGPGLRAITIIVLAFVGVGLAAALVFFLFNEGESSTTTVAGGTTTSAAPTTTSDTLSLADVVEAARPSTLKVLTLDQDEFLLGSGSGWVYDGDEGLIATNNHVINGGAGFLLSGDGIMDGEQRPAELFGAAPCEDLALVRISDASGLLAFVLGTQSELRAGDEVVAVGFPSDASLELPLAATAGVVSVVETSLNEPDLFDVPHLTNVIRTDAAINPGNSGGPLLTRDLTLVGVNTAGFTERDGMPIQNENYAIGVDRVADVLGVLARGESIGWAGLGLETFFDNANRASLLSTAVVPGSPADEVGVPSQLLFIDRIDGVPMDGTLQTYCDVVGSHTTGDTATFTFIDPDNLQELVFDVPFG